MELSYKRGLQWQYKRQVIMADEITKACCTQNREQCEKLMDVRFTSLQNLFESKVQATEKATTLAAEVLKGRLEALNELRQMAQDRDVNFVTKVEFVGQVKEIESLRLSRAEMTGKASQQSVNVAYLISILSLLISLIAVVLRLLGK